MALKESDSNPLLNTAIESQGGDSQLSLHLPPPTSSGNINRERAIKNAIKYNVLLNQVRREERKVSMDMQTFTVHYPVGYGKDNKMLQKNVSTGRYRKVGKYPVATLHGQYQDWYIDYTSDELKYFPINTVLYGPVSSKSSKPTHPQPQPQQSQVNGQQQEEESGSESSDSESDGGSSCSDENRSFRVKKEHGSDREDDINENSCDTCSWSGSSSTGSNEDLTGSGKNGKDSRLSQANTCKLCKGSSKNNKPSSQEELIYCSECSAGVHPSCLQLTTDMVDVIKSYKWQCSDCKTCVLCNKPHSEDKLLFCDLCDRGYHTFCVGLRIIPNGKWVCKLCGPTCAECGSTKPGEGSKVNWHHETIKILSPNGDTLRRHQVLCLSCYKQRKSR